MYCLNLSQFNKHLLTVNYEKWWKRMLERPQVEVMEFESMFSH